jgi:hypothetical protein
MRDHWWEVHLMQGRWMPDCSPQDHSTQDHWKQEQKIGVHPKKLEDSRKLEDSKKLEDSTRDHW